MRSRVQHLERLGGIAPLLHELTKAYGQMAWEFPAGDPRETFKRHCFVAPYSEDDIRALAKLDPAALVDATAIVATFQQMDRIADAPGIALDAMVDIASQDVQAELGLASFASAHDTNSSPLGRLAGRVLAPIRGPMMRLASRFLR